MDKLNRRLDLMKGKLSEMGDRLEDITQNAAQRLKRHGGQEMGQRWHLKKRRLVIS